MPDDDVAAYIGRWRPSPAIPAQAAAFARDVTQSAGPGDKERAKSLLAAARRASRLLTVSGDGGCLDLRFSRHVGSQGASVRACGWS